MAPDTLVCSSILARVGRGSRGSSIFRKRLWIRPGRGVRVDLTRRLTSRPAAAPCSFASSRLRRGSGLASAPQPMIASAIAPGDFLFDLVAGVAGPFCRRSC